MNRSFFKRTVPIAFGLAALFLTLAPGADAQCMKPPAQNGVLLQPWQNQARFVPGTFVPVSDPAGASIVGLWKVTSTIGGAVVDFGFDAWHSDGTETLNDVAAPHVCLGVWEKAGPATYKLYHPGLSFDAGGNFTGTVVIRQQVTVSQDGNTYAGTFTVDFFDLNGNNIGHLAGEVAGVRVVVA